MKTFSILVRVLSVTAVLAAGAEDAPDKSAASKEYGSPDADRDQAHRTSDESEWRDFETSDPGTTFRDFWEARRKLEPPTKQPEQTAPNVDVVVSDEPDPAKNKSTKAKTENELPQVELPEQSESVRQPKETHIPDSNSAPAHKR